MQTGLGRRRTATTRKDRLVGRSHELERIGSVLDRLQDGYSGVVEVVGEPGLGKTRLLEEMLSLAESRGCLCLAGRAVEFEADLPFAIFVDALDCEIASAQPPLDELPADSLAELAAIFPSVPGSAGKRPTGLQAERYRAYEAVGSVLGLLARDQPLVLALDDAHWADDASVELLSHLVRRLPERSVLLAVAFRALASAGRLERALLEPLRDGTGERLELAPLSIGEAGELLDPTEDSRLVEELYRDSGGNPFYLKELARAHGKLTDPHGREPARARDRSASADRHGVPHAVQEAIAADIRRLSPSSQALARAAAVVGDPFDPDLAADVARISEGEALASLDDLVDNELVRRDEQARRFTFRHPIVRRAVYESATSGWRLAAHERAAAALEARGEPAATRAPHLERSAKTADEEAIATLTEAANANAPRAPALAARWYEAALRLIPEVEENRERRLGLLVPMGITLGSSGRLERATEVLRQVVDLLPREMSELKVQAAMSYATVQMAIGRVDETRETLCRLLAELREAEDHAHAGMIRVALATTSFVCHDFKGMGSWADEALASLDPDDPGVAIAHGSRATVAYSMGDADRARAEVSQAAALIERLPDKQIAVRPGACFWLGWSETLLERYEAAHRHLDRGIAIARSCGQELWFAQMNLQKGLGLLSQGELRRAGELIDIGVESALLSSNDLALAPGLAVRCWLDTVAGERSAAISHGERALAAAERANSAMFLHFAQFFLAQSWLELGHPERCRSLLLGPGGDDSYGLAIHRTRRYEALTRAELALGDLTAADTWARRAGEVAQRLQLDLPATEAARARAAVLLERGDTEEAAAAALAGADCAARIGAAVEEARARTLAGCALIASMRRQEAVAELERAEQMLARAGATLYRKLAARELRRLGRRPPADGSHDRARSGVEALSPRELEVAELVSAGRKNREIAAELFVSTKTVEAHISQIFQKLGVSSRVEVASAFERERRRHAEEARAQMPV